MLPLKQFQCWSDFKEDLSASSFYASFLQAIDGVVSLAFCPHVVVSHSPPHFRSYETPTRLNESTQAISNNNNSEHL